MKNITKALLDAQKKIENATKDAKNPHFRNNYATLESVLDAVKSVANASGIVIVQTGGKDAEGHFIETRLLHESGEEIVSKIYLVLEKNNMQGLGSAITYARRYSLAALFAIGQDDDDGNGASKPAPSQAPQQKPVANKPQAPAPRTTFSARPQTTQQKPELKAVPQQTNNTEAYDDSFNFGNFQGE